MGNHSMLPPPEIDANLRSVEDPSPYPSGPNTSFHDPTPMPARFTEEAVPALNKQRQEEKKRKQLNPTYHTTTSEIGSLDISASDLPMRWYGLRGEFTNAFFLGGNDTKSKVNTGLNAAPSTRQSTPHVARSGRCSDETSSSRSEPSSTSPNAAISQRRRPTMFPSI